MRTYLHDGRRNRGVLRIPRESRLCKFGERVQNDLLSIPCLTGHRFLQGWPQNLCRFGTDTWLQICDGIGRVRHRPCRCVLQHPLGRLKMNCTQVDNLWQIESNRPRPSDNLIPSFLELFLDIFIGVVFSDKDER